MIGFNKISLSSWKWACYAVISLQFVPLTCIYKYRFLTQQVKDWLHSSACSGKEWDSWLLSPSSLSSLSMDRWCLDLSHTIAAKIQKYSSVSFYALKDLWVSGWWMLWMEQEQKPACSSKLTSYLRAFGFPEYFRVILENYKQERERNESRKATKDLFCKCLFRQSVIWQQEI